MQERISPYINNDLDYVLDNLLITYSNLKGIRRDLITNICNLLFLH